ncbi:hypothetical protein D3C78_1575700 [compost metagenome]
MSSLIVSHAGALARTVFAVEFIDGIAELAVEVTPRRNAALQGDVVLTFALVDIRASCGSRHRLITLIATIGRCCRDIPAICGGLIRFRGVLVEVA